MQKAIILTTQETIDTLLWLKRLEAQIDVFQMINPQYVIFPSGKKKKDLDKLIASYESMVKEIRADEDVIKGSIY
jgi:hypothetical protein